uniref:Uncharacterized protein n=1 Tax=Anguilla anguilla TaxID=7936 RepID=A0A0E9QM88_ANGAN
MSLLSLISYLPTHLRAVNVFPSDVSDHCVMARVRNTISAKIKPGFILKQNL